MVLTDRLMTVFSAQGHEKVAAAHLRIAAAQKLMADEEAKLQAGGDGKSFFRARTAYQQALIANLSTAKSQARSAALQVGALAVAFYFAVRAADDFGKQVMNIRDLTGSSNRDSARAAMLMRVSGMKDSTALNQVLQSGQSVFQGQGRAALSRLGIASNPNQNGLSLLTQIMDRLDGYQDGLRKTQLMQQLFGQKGAESMLPLLRMTKAQRDEAFAIADAYDSKALPAIQQFQTLMEITKEKVLVGVVYPLAQSLMPILTEVANFIGKASRAFSVLNNAGGTVFGGWLSAIVIAGLMVVTLGKVVGAVMTLVSAYRALAVAGIIAQAASGPKGWAMLAGGALAIGGGIMAINHAIDAASSSAPPMDSAANKIDRAATKMEAAVDRLPDAFDSLKGKNVPGGLSQGDTSEIWRQGKAYAVG